MKLHYFVTTLSLYTHVRFSGQLLFSTDCCNYWWKFVNNF